MASTIRAATPADAPVIHALLRELAVFEGGTVKASAADLERDLAAGLFAALLAEEDGRAVGVLTHFPTYSSWLGRPGVMIHDLFVTEQARGKGVGEGLVAALVDLAKECGWARMDVNVLASNSAGRRFYERMGLTPTEGWLGYRIEGGALGLDATERLLGNPNNAARLSKAVTQADQGCLVEAPLRDDT